MAENGNGKSASIKNMLMIIMLCVTVGGGMWTAGSHYERSRTSEMEKSVTKIEANLQILTNDVAAVKTDIAVLKEKIK